MTQVSAGVTVHPARQPQPGPGRAWHWLTQGLGLWRGAFWQGLLLALLPLIFEGLLQLLPAVGIVLSKLLTPLLGALALWWLHRRCQGAGGLPVYGLPGWPVAVAVMLLGLFVFAWQTAVLALLAGPGSALSLLQGDMAALAGLRWPLALMLASGMLPAALLGLMSMQMVLGGHSLQVAWRWNWSVVKRCWQPLLVWHVGLALLLFSLLWWPWGLLLLAPLGLHGGYAMWCDIVSGQAEDRHAAGSGL